MEDSFTRRDFLRLSGGVALAAAMGAACDGSSSKTKSGSAARSSRAARAKLRIIQYNHAVPDYDAFFDDYARRWGEGHDVDVIVEHVPAGDLIAHADAEVSAGRGHDLFAVITAAAGFEDDVVDQRETVEEVEAKVGKMAPLVERSVFNPKTSKYFAFPDFWAPNPALYRTDLWDAVEAGLVPDSWETVLRAAPRLKATGHPLGIGLAGSLDSNFNAATLLFTHGASLQDEAGQVTLNRAATVEAVKLGSEIYRRGMTEEVLFFDDRSDNRFLLSGKGSLVLDAISAIRAVEQQDAGLAGRIGLAAGPVGPGGRLQSNGVLQSYMTWKFSAQPDLASRFLVDLVVNYQEPFLRSQFYNLPAFPGAVPDLAALLEADTAQPSGKYRPLALATEWSTNAGHPGYTNAAVAEVNQLFLLSKMFASAARGEKTAEEAAADAEAEIKPIFEKWRERGKI